MTAVQTINHCVPFCALVPVTVLPVAQSIWLKECLVNCLMHATTVVPDYLNWVMRAIPEDGPGHPSHPDEDDRIKRLPRLIRRLPRLR